MSLRPHFSIVVPTCNRPASLRRLLGHVSGLAYDPRLFEVILVDDGSSPPVDAHAGRLKSLDCRLVRQQNSGPAAARNTGAAAGRGEFLAFTDDDCFPHPRWLTELHRALRKCPSAVCGGRTVNRRKADLFAEATQMVTDYLYAHYNPALRHDGFFPTNNLALPRKAFLEMGGFDPALRFGEDRDFCYRWSAGGNRFVYAPSAIVYHDHPLKIGSFLRLHFHYGRGTCLFRLGCHQKGLAPVPMSPAAWYLKLIFSGYSRHGGIKGVGMSLLLAACQMATAAGIAHELSRRPKNPRS